jgi:rSAM/selenodomain-associated transferase 2
MIKKPEVSIILPVLNEAGRINEAISHLRARIRDDTTEIIVVDGDPLGSTINAIRYDGVVRITSAKGRAHQMNSGAVLASGDILLFLHADTLLPNHALAKIAAAMSDKRLVAGAFDLGINSDRNIFRITEKYVYLRTRLTRVPFGDQAIFIRREYFEKIRGYKDIPLMEDVEIMGRIRKSGDRICIIPAKVLTSPRRWEKEGILFCTFRNWITQILFALGISPERLKKWYQEGGTAT